MSKNEEKILELLNHNGKSDGDEEAPKELTKTQRKKLAKKQLILERNHEQRARMRLRKKEKRAKAREEGLPLPKRRRTGLPMALSSCRIRVAIDMAFEKVI